MARLGIVSHLAHAGLFASFGGGEHAPQLPQNMRTFFAHAPAAVASFVHACNGATCFGRSPLCGTLAQIF